jgi:hypothetical protein
MYYKNYELQITYEGCIIRDEQGKVLMVTPTEDGAKEIIDKMLIFSEKLKNK